MFVCGAWWFYWECGAVFDRAFGGGDCERISCEDILHQSPGVVYFGDRERIGTAGSWDLAESGAVFADWRLRGLYDVFNVFERGAETFRWRASGGGDLLYGAFCGAGAGLLLWGLAGGTDALTKNEHTVWDDPDGVLVFLFFCWLPEGGDGFSVARVDPVRCDGTDRLHDEGTLHG